MSLEKKKKLRKRKFVTTVLLLISDKHFIYLLRLLVFTNDPTHTQYHSCVVKVLTQSQIVQRAYIRLDVAGRTMHIQGCAVADLHSDSSENKQRLLTLQLSEDTSKNCHETEKAGKYLKFGGWFCCEGGHPARCPMVSQCCAMRLKLLPRIYVNL